MKKLSELGISPAPWWVGKKGDGFFFGMITCNTKDGKKTVATSNYNFDEHKADDLLIAAAPELYDALYDVVAYCESTHLVPSERFGKVLAKAKAALAKASGEEIGERE